MTHQALLLSADVELGMFNPAVKGYFAALTNDERLVLIETRLGMFAPRLENRGVEVAKRSAIAGAELVGRRLRLRMKDARVRVLAIPQNVPGFSNQSEFLRDVARVLGAEAGWSPATLSHLVSTANSASSPSRPLRAS